MKKTWIAAVLALYGTLSLACSRTPDDDASRRAEIGRLYEGYRKEFPGLAERTAPDILNDPEWRETVFVDVRDPVERAVSGLPGALTPEAVERDPVLYACRRLVAYCTVGYRSGVWARTMAQRGFDVANLPGGILAWLHAGGLLAAPDGRPTRTVHVYGRGWDLAPVGFESTW